MARSCRALPGPSGNESRSGWRGSIGGLNSSDRPEVIGLTIPESGVAVRQEGGHSDAAELNAYNHVRDVLPPTDSEEIGVASRGLAADSY